MPASRGNVRVTRCLNPLSYDPAAPRIRYVSDTESLLNANTFRTWHNTPHACLLISLSSSPLRFEFSGLEMNARLGFQSGMSVFE